MTGTTSYRDFVRALVESKGIRERLAGRSAIVLERIAFGGGETRWYRLQSGEDLVEWTSQAQPGSSVSFYFDDRLEWHVLDASRQAALLELIESRRDALVGRSAGGINLEMVVVAGPHDLADQMANMGLEPALVGAFPGRDDDGVNAVTFDLPDRDGVVRPHPH